MGCISSKNLSEEDLINYEIEKQIKLDKNKKREIKMLLLGAGESGKSTIIKQMKILHKGGFSKDEILNFKEIIYSNLINSIQTIILSMGKFDLEFATDLDKELEFILNTDFNPTKLSDLHFQYLETIWNDDGVKECLKISNQYQLLDSAEYFLSNLNRIKEINYKPSNDDILRSRIKTTGIIETQFNFDDTTFRMIDVGGQRSERKKWVHCFEGVTSILYLIGLSEYDQMLAEDESVNRMQEALQLFESVCNSHWFEETAVILFLNKTDLFKIKLKNSPLKQYFSDYNGTSFDEAANFFRNKFENLNKNKTIYTHFTCATDTTNIQFVMAAVKDILMESTLKDVGLL